MTALARPGCRFVAILFTLIGVGACREQEGPGAKWQVWPDAPIRFIVPFAPGGPADSIARLVGDNMGAYLGQPVIIDNRAGSGGNIGTALAAKAAADGYTVLVTTSAFAVNVSLFEDPGYDAGKDFIPTALLATQPNAILVNASLPAKTLADLFALAKTQKLGFATPGNGTTPHLTGEQVFRAHGKLDMVAVHFKGAAPAVVAIASGQPPVGAAAISTPLPYIRTGRLRALAVSSARRIAALPDVPTLAEAGIADVEDYTWVGLFLPAGTPPAIVQRLNEAANRAIQSPDVRARLDALVFEPVGGTPQAFAGHVRDEIAKWGKIVREGHLR